MNNRPEISIMLAGEAGQGIKSIESVLVQFFKRSGFHVFATKEYMSRVRGGTNSTTLRISGEPVTAPLQTITLFLPLAKEAFARYQDLLSEATIIIGEKSVIEQDAIHDIAFTSIAEELGNKRFASMVAAGAVAGVLGLDPEPLRERVRAQFSGKDEAVVDGNIRAVDRGAEAGKVVAGQLTLSFSATPSDHVPGHMLLTGTDAIAIGAVAGGCDAVFAYPMTPGSGVLTALAQAAREVGIVVEQVEDEIGVINMALGAWYAGARAMVTTSGGGFALMTEGLSLSGMTETPVVIHLAQRPGPATGLPTRTEQGDLNLSLHAGHGTFPRIILAPGSLEQAFYLAQQAFNLADELQVPVILLTDQYFVDMYYDLPEFDLARLTNKNHLVEAGEDYRRYCLTDSGISPRGVPGFGPGRVCVDSDEHDESGRITEDLDGISLEMKNKRFRKFKAVAEAAIAPDRYGAETYRTLFVAWGSTLNAAREALARADRPDAALLHFSQVWPLHADTAALLNRAKRVIVIENNQDAAFAALLRRETGVGVDENILKYNGLPFTVEELCERMKETG